MLKMNICVTFINRVKFLSSYGLKLLQQETVKIQKAKVRSLVFKSKIVSSWLQLFIGMGFFCKKVERIGLWVSKLEYPVL